MAKTFTDGEKDEFLKALERDGSLKEYNEYLDRLRASGVTNMYGAGSFLMDEYELDNREANAVLSNWMKTFGTRKEAGEVSR